MRDKTGNLHTKQYKYALASPLLQWKSNKYYVFWLYVCSLRYAARKEHAPCCIIICDLSGPTILFHITS